MPSVEINNQRVLFVHIPKTGGTSVTRWLQELGRLRLHADIKCDGLNISPQHLTWADLDCMWGGDYFNYCFAVVRNPFTRMESEFRMRQRLRSQGLFGGQLHFSTWLTQALAGAGKHMNHLDNHIRPQWNFISDRLRIFKFEEGMENIMTQISVDLKIAAPQQVPHALASSPDTPDISWDRADILRMQEFYRLDFEQFGYSTEPEPTILTGM